MMLTIDRQFPNAGDLQRASWAPIILRPIMGSPEQFVIGVVAVGSSGSHLERANRLERLECFYGEQSTGVVLATNVALDDVEDWLSASATLEGYIPILSGETVGAVRETEGASLRDIAVSWMGALSSLYVVDRPTIHAVAQLVEADDVLEARGRETLPEQVMDRLSITHPSLVAYFSSEIRLKGRRTNASHVSIDFAGQKLVANFGTIRPANYAASVDRIKHRMWDLKISRDQAVGSLIPMAHEMLVQYPTPDTGERVSEKQALRVQEALYALEKQADQEEIRFRPLKSVEAIAQHLAEKEAA